MTQQPKSSSESTVGKPDGALVAALGAIQRSRHPYVNPTLKRLAKAADVRMSKL